MIDLTDSHNVTGAYVHGDYRMIRTKYNDAGTRYAFDVLDGKIMAGYMMRLACFRHVQDLKRADAGKNDFPFKYDLEKVGAILKFASICPDVDTGEPSKLMLWQKFALSQLFGWVTMVVRNATHALI